MKCKNCGKVIRRKIYKETGFCSIPCNLEFINKEVKEIKELRKK